VIPRLDGELALNVLNETLAVPENWRECQNCGLISAMPRMRPSLTADCPRCHHLLWRMRGCSFQLPLACALAGAMFFSFAVVAPFLEISSHGQFQLARLETGPLQLAAQGFDIVALLVFAVSVILPGVKLAIILVTLVGLETHLLPKGILKDIFRWYEPIKPWSMVDVYLLGFLVAYTRLAVIASVHLDTALFALIGLMLSTTAANAFLDSEAVWRALDADAGEPRNQPPATADCILISCPSCLIVNRALPGDRCRRCDDILEPRKPASLARCWAFVAAAAILYLPANMYPVMTISSLVQTQQYTIMGGIFELVQNGLWPLAVLVFFASITIPVMKLLMLGHMLIATQMRSEEHLLGRTIAFRFVDFIGRWSMIDVFMISILVALVRFGKFSNVQAEFGASCFAAVVVLTMFAVNAFDPRIMWDRAATQPAKPAYPAGAGQAVESA
jgi:paraquat-inducible protein A